MVNLRKPPLMVTVGTALLLIVGGGLAYWGLERRSSGIRGLPAGIQAIPEGATAAVSISTDADQWQQLRQLGTPETQANFDQQLADWRDRWLTRNDLSYSQHVKPWIGSEATLAWLPSAEASPDTASAPQSRRVLLLPIADGEAALAVAESLPFSEADDPIEYRGVALRALPSTVDDPEAKLWVGNLGNELVLMAEGETAAQQAINAYRQGKSLANLPGYRRSFEHLEVQRSFGKLYGNIPALTQILAETSQPPLPPALTEAFQDSLGLAATLDVTSQGLKIRGTSWLAAGSDRTYANTNVAAQMPQLLPRDTLLMASGGNFRQLWQDLLEQRAWGSLTAFDPKNLALTFQNSTGLTLENDLLPWMAGEFALALVPPPSAEGAAGLPNPGLVVLSQVSDRPRAEQTFTRLDTVVENRYRFSILNEPVGKLELVKWISPFEGLTLSRGWLNSTTAFLSVGADVEAAVIPQPQRPLSTAPLFQLTTAGVPDLNSGHFYINLAALRQQNNSLFLPNLPMENQGILRAIEALGVTATVLDEQRLRYDLYLALERGNRPGPLPSPSRGDSSGED